MTAQPARAAPVNNVVHMGSTAAEKLLGCFLLHPQSIPEELGPDDFLTTPEPIPGETDPAEYKRARERERLHRQLFEVVARLVQQHRLPPAPTPEHVQELLQIDSPVLVDALNRADDDHDGPRDGIGRLLDAACAPENAVYYARVLLFDAEDRDAARHRRWVSEGAIDEYARERKAKFQRMERLVAKLGGTPAPGDAFECLDLQTAAAEGIQRIEWLLPGWIAPAEIALVAGHAGGGKSTLAVTMGLALATATPWCGIEVAQPARVLHVDLEEGPFYTARLALRCCAGLLGVDDQTGRPVVPSHDTYRVVSINGPLLNAPEALQKLEASILAFRPQLVVIDSWTQASLGVDENSAFETALLYAAMFRLRDTYKVAFLVVHHAGHASRSRADIEKPRGTTAHSQQPATVWSAEPGDEPGTMRLRQSKRRGGPKLGMLVRVVEDTETCVRLAGEELDTGPAGREGAKEWAVNYLDGRGILPFKVIWAAATAEGITERTLRRALKELVGAGELVEHLRGNYSAKGGQR